jgi:hypothetical protein
VFSGIGLTIIKIKPHPGDFREASERSEFVAKHEHLSGYFRKRTLSLEHLRGAEFENVLWKKIKRLVGMD